MPETEISLYLHHTKPEAVLENETHKILWDCEIQTDYFMRSGDKISSLWIRRKEVIKLILSRQQTIERGYPEESWRAEKTCCHLIFSENRQVKTGVKNLLIIIIVSVNNKKMGTCRIVDFAVLADHRLKIKEIDERDRYIDLARELKFMERESYSITNCNWCTWSNLQRNGTLGDKILTRVLEIWGDLLSLKLQWETIS